MSSHYFLIKFAPVQRCDKKKIIQWHGCQAKWRKSGATCRKLLP